MEITPASALQPRKTPRQARSVATVEAIFEATIQVLLAEGAPGLTTSRVAERAGVSVGTMYQYFPHKQSLLYAVLQQHLAGVVNAVEDACRKFRGQPAAALVEGLVQAYVDAKTANVEVSRALFLVAVEMDTAELIGGMTKRINAATMALLASACDAHFDDLPAVTFTLLAALAGNTRTVFERGAKPAQIKVLRHQVTLMCRAYLLAAAVPKAPPKPAPRTATPRASA
jgi:AcrR family transcriptional regulator